MDLEDQLLVAKSITLMKMLLEIAEDSLKDQRSEIDWTIVEKIMREQTELLNHLLFK